ncbi:accessory factor UbiK family protein [Hahella ganghwensis]|uniref:accessory factor UbiK family protein n=1 Tax=Hahella ganghwensis TaxID=286420 RepID=UPI00036BA3BB|nr:accessory factor UbiK family protein [Hahella ganghwensis]
MAVSPFDILNSINQQFGQFIPDVAKSAQEDVHQQAKAALTSIISKLDLVTREEFDVQTEVLRRTREKLETLEKRVAELEQQLDKNDA